MMLTRLQLNEGLVGDHLAWQTIAELDGQTRQQVDFFIALALPGPVYKGTEQQAVRSVATPIFTALTESL